MYKNCGFIADIVKATIERVIGVMSLKALAEENPNDNGSEPTNQPNTEPVVNYEDLISKARKEEKDKQYKIIERYKTQVNSLTTQHNDDMLKIASLEKQVKEAQDKLLTAGKGDSDELKTLKNQVKTLTEEKEKAEKELKDLEAKKDSFNKEEVEKQVREELEKEYEVKTYKATKLAELKDDILVPELVFGETKEDIDKSIESALARSEEIKKSLGLTKEKQKRTPKSPSNPSVNKVQDKEYSVDYLSTLDVRSPEYAEVRKSLGLK